MWLDAAVLLEIGVINCLIFGVPLLGDLGIDVAFGETRDPDFSDCETQRDPGTCNDPLVGSTNFAASGFRTGVCTGTALACGGATQDPTGDLEGDRAHKASIRCGFVEFANKGPAFDCACNCVPALDSLTDTFACAFHPVLARSSDSCAGSGHCEATDEDGEGNTAFVEGGANVVL
mmetsp:Transcript_99201/g.156929  ORF Transcript_99201/g.156929 Transcript_99201/m.156929 type:complete len:176 (+) Transcript_99201:366-893(+)